VALHPEGEFHFEMGRTLAERLGYSLDDLDRIPPEAIESFAGVGYYFHLADLKEGERILDLGGGSGMDTFVAALKVGPSDHVIGVDMTDEQRLKAERLRDRSGMRNVTYVKAYIESLPCADASVDAVVSNGVINPACSSAAGFCPRAQAQRLSGRWCLAHQACQCHHGPNHKYQGSQIYGPKMAYPIVLEGSHVVHRERNHQAHDRGNHCSYPRPPCAGAHSIPC
jgi:SAM-dependent methyltransferase